MKATEAPWKRPQRKSWDPTCPAPGRGLQEALEDEINGWKFVGGAEAPNEMMTFKD